MVEIDHRTWILVFDWSKVSDAVSIKLPFFNPFIQFQRSSKSCLSPINPSATLVFVVLVWYAALALHTTDNGLEAAITRAPWSSHLPPPMNVSEQGIQRVTMDSAIQLRGEGSEFLNWFEENERVLVLASD